MTALSQTGLLKRSLVWLAIFVCLGLAVPLVMAGGDAFRGVLDVSPLGLAVLAGVMLTGIQLRVYFFRRLLRFHSVGLGQWPGLLAFLSVAFTANVTPGSAGAPILALALLRRFRVPLPVTAVVLGAGVVVDALVLLSLMLAVAAWMLGAAANVAPLWQVLVPVMVLTAGLLVVWACLRHYRLLVGTLIAVLRLVGVSPTRRHAVMRVVVRLRRAVQELLALPRAEQGILLVLGLSQSLLFYSVLYIAVQALGGDISWPQAFVVQILALTSARLLLLPGGVGGAEAMGILLLSAWVPPALAGSAILVWRFMTFYLYLFAGGLALLFAGRSLTADAVLSGPASSSFTRRR